jgi:hypothetical protein
LCVGGSGVVGGLRAGGRRGGGARGGGVTVGGATGRDGTEPRQRVAGNS